LTLFTLLSPSIPKIGRRTVLEPSLSHSHSRTIQSGFGSKGKERRKRLFLSILHDRPKKVELTVEKLLFSIKK